MSSSAAAVTYAPVPTVLGKATPGAAEVDQSGDESKYRAAWNRNRNYVGLYMLAMGSVALVFQTFHDIGLSTLLTFSVFVQCVALGALCVAIMQRQSVKGISLKCVAMQGLSFAFRLSSTVWLKGYIPVDSTGDWLYQLVDAVALGLCCLIAYFIAIKFRNTYDEENETYPAGWTVLICACLAAVIHPDLNNRPVFDAIWTCSLYTDVFSMLPQIFMMTNANRSDSKCEVDALSAHYVALIGVSRVIDMIFWSYGYEELAPEKGGFNIAGWTVLISHFLHLVLMLDFLYLYVRAIFKFGISTSIDSKLDIGLLENEQGAARLTVSERV